MHITDFCVEAKPAASSLFLLLFKIVITIPHVSIGTLLPLTICGIPGLILAHTPFYAGALFLVRAKLAGVSIFRLMGIRIETIKSQARSNDVHDLEDIYDAEPVETLGIAIEDGNKDGEEILAAIQKLDRMKESGEVSEAEYLSARQKYFAILAHED